MVELGGEEGVVIDFDVELEEVVVSDFWVWFDL